MDHVKELLGTAVICGVLGLVWWLVKTDDGQAFREGWAAGAEKADRINEELPALHEAEERLADAETKLRKAEQSVSRFERERDNLDKLETDDGRVLYLDKDADRVFSKLRAAKELVRRYKEDVEQQQKAVDEINERIDAIRGHRFHE